MTKEIVKLNPDEFGLNDKQAQTIESAFLPKIKERNALAEIYGQIIAKEISPETCAEAKDCRLKLVKVRTGIAAIHKTEKAFALAYGKFCDAWKNKETEPVVQMETALEDFEKHYEKIEAEKVAELQTERALELGKYQDELAFVPDNLGTLEPEVWSNYLLGVKTSYDIRIKAEKAAAEAAAEAVRVDKLGRARQVELYKYSEYLKELKTVDALGKMTETDFNTFIQSLQLKKSDHDKEQERMKKRTEQLEREAKEHERLVRMETEKREKEQKELAEKAAAEKKEREEKERKEREAHEAALKVEREKNERIQKELAEKAAAEKKEREAEELRVQAELNKGDAEKVKDLLIDLSGLKTKYSFKSKKNQKMLSDTNILIDKVIAHIQKF